MAMHDGKKFTKTYVSVRTARAALRRYLNQGIRLSPEGEVTAEFLFLAGSAATTVAGFTAAGAGVGKWFGPQGALVGAGIGLLAGGYLAYFGLRWYVEVRMNPDQSVTVSYTPV